MSFTQIKAKNQGFTIVELLIVVVVIAILAAITIVSYNGITNRANQSAAKAAAATVQKKVELYNAEMSVYPTALELVNATSDKSFATPESAFTGTKAGTTPNALGEPAPTKDNGKTKIKYATCGTSPNYTGASVTYWNYGDKLDSADETTSTLKLGTGC